MASLYYTVSNATQVSNIFYKHKELGSIKIYDQILDVTVIIMDIKPEQNTLIGSNLEQTFIHGSEMISEGVWFMSSYNCRQSNVLKQFLT